MKVSVILPTYNRAYCLRRSVESVLNQTSPVCELIIVDDGSLDETQAIAAEYAKKHPVLYIRHETNRGVAEARNTGMRAAQGEWIAFQDSDDCWALDKLEKQARALDETGADFCYTYACYELPGEKPQICILPNVDIASEKMNGFIYPEMLRHNLVDAPTLIMKQACYQYTGGFDSVLPALEDYDYALRLARRFDAVFVPECLHDKVLSKDSISVNAVNHLIASCMLAGRYKKDLLQYGQFDYFVEKILLGAEKIGAQPRIAAFLEKMLTQ